jgi:hypothetical protein
MYGLPFPGRVAGTAPPNNNVVPPIRVISEHYA